MDIPQMAVVAYLTVMDTCMGYAGVYLESAREVKLAAEDA